MIVPMSKVHIVTQSSQRDALLEALGRLGVVHIEPIDRDNAIPDDKHTEELGELNQAIRILQGVTPQGAAPDAEPLHIAHEAILLHKSLIDEREQLNTLLRQADQLAIWGNTRIRDLTDLREAGIDIQFYLIPKQALDDIEAECLKVMASPSAQQVLVAIVDRQGKFSAPAEATAVPWPMRDLPTVKQEATVLDQSIQQNSLRMGALAQALGLLSKYKDERTSDASFCVAQRSGMAKSSLFALQGWTPEKQARELHDRLAAMSISTAVDVLAAEEKENPPTLIEYPKWAKPIKALFDMLGTLPGYDEVDLSPFFMIALPLFTAMLIGDGGYGLLLAGAGLVFYRPLSRTAGKQAASLLIIFGLATLIYGTLTAVFFGMTPATLAAAGFEGLSRTLASVAILYREDGEASRALIMKLSLMIGCVHLVLAHFRRVIEFWPDCRAYAEMAWMVILADMMVLIYYVMFVGVGAIPSAVGLVILLGLAVVIWFSEPQANPIKRVMTGLASAILPMLNTFSDTMSYIRLFAVGLSSFYIADAFNGLGADVAAGSSWILGAPIIVFGHALNLGLAAIAIFAHGVRLNMLEFSNNVGVKWAGHAFQPFAQKIEPSIGENEL